MKERKCVKCGSASVKVRFVESGVIPHDSNNWVDEHLSCKCDECECKWSETPEDNPTSARRISDEDINEMIDSHGIFFGDLGEVALLPENAMLFAHSIMDKCGLYPEVEDD